MRRRGALTLLAALLAVSACGGAEQPASALSPDVTIADGAVRGADDGTVLRWQGIPYAAPPTGERRWAAPQPPARWTTARDATTPGARCLQAPDAEAANPRNPVPQSEDCLSLGVTTPSGTAADAKLPVLVWLHGGGLRSGAGSDYDASALAAEGGIVVVTVNYRLGVLGFLGLPGLADSGAFGLLDQQAALRWVRANVGAFGGDPARVTVAGESGGADSVCAQLTSPGARDLFDRAILQSFQCGKQNALEAIVPGIGPLADTWKPLSTVEGVGAGWAKAYRCADVGCLRKLPAAQVNRPSAVYWSPATGTPTLPKRPSDALSAGEGAPVPIVMGTTRDEGLLFAAGSYGAKPLTSAAFTALLAKSAGAKAAAAAKAYPLAGRTPNRAWADVVTDHAYACPALAQVRDLAGRTEVRMFEFDDPAAPPFAPAPADLTGGASHGSEVAYLFRRTPGQPTLTAAQEALATRMRAYWAGFVKGDAAGWPAFTGEGQVLSLRPGGSVVVAAAGLGAPHTTTGWR